MPWTGQLEPQVQGETLSLTPKVEHDIDTQSWYF